jgi:hypothetical protein
MPPPADAEVSLAQLTELVVPDVVLDEVLDEQPVASRVRAATPARANLYGDLTSASLKAFPEADLDRPAVPGRRRGDLATHLAPS